MSAVDDDVLAELRRQNATYGERNHDPATWAVILAQEVGDAARRALACKFNSGDCGAFRTELVRLAANAVAAIECIDRSESAKREESPSAATYWRYTWRGGSYGDGD